MGWVGAPVRDAAKVLECGLSYLSYGNKESEQNSAILLEPSE
jgi:hypothetical protein